MLATKYIFRHTINRRIITRVESSHETYILIVLILGIQYL